MEIIYNPTVMLIAGVVVALLVWVVIWFKTDWFQEARSDFGCFVGVIFMPPVVGFFGSIIWSQVVIVATVLGVVYGAWLLIRKGA